jgi:hypothetical protein
MIYSFRISREEKKKSLSLAPDLRGWPLLRIWPVSATL